MTVIAFAIETIPDIEGGRRLYNLHGLNDKDVVNVMFHKRRQEGGETEQLRLHLQRVVTASLLIREGETLKPITLGNPECSEAQLLQSLFDAVGNDCSELVSWDGNAFSLPVLHYRSLVHGIPAPDFWQDIGDKHLDLSERLAAHRPQANAPLGEIATLLGLPGRPHVDGGTGTWDRFLAGDLPSLSNDCDIDVLNIYLVYLRFQLIRGQLGQQAYAQACQRLRHTLQQTGETHLEPFLTAWPEQL